MANNPAPTNPAPSNPFADHHGETFRVTVASLRAAGCVFAEDEARLLIEAAGSGAELGVLVGRRADGVPLELILGWVEFSGLRLRVVPDVFVPRQRTAVLVERAVELTRPGDRVLDLCCGVGAIGAALAARVPGLVVLAADVDPVAAACARENLAACHGQVFCGDLFDALPPATAPLDLIVINAPYVPSEAIALMPSEARDWEPRWTLDGGQDGLDVHRRVFSAAPSWLVPGGHLLIECSEAQAPLSARLGREAGLRTDIQHDDERDGTVVIATRLRASAHATSRQSGPTR